jgi:hypothetical protein
MEEIIDYLMSLLANRFSDSVAQVFFGDIGVYLPQMFGSSRRDQKAIIALSPENDHPIEGQKTELYENRTQRLNIITMVNITPFFRANPEEAYGERMLVRLTTQIKNFLNEAENQRLGGRVRSTNVGEIDWAWTARGDQAVRAARILYEWRIQDRRMP